MTGGFQTSVQVQPAPAVAGDFASANPYATFDAGPGGLVCGSNGVTVGLFAWVTPPHDPDGGPTIANNFYAGNGPQNVAGFVHREAQGLNTIYLSDASMLVPAGFGITLMIEGDFWVVNNGTSQNTIGQKAFAKFANGQALFANAGANPSTASITGSIGNVNFTVTASLSGDVLTVTGSGALNIPIGAVVSGTVGGSGVTVNTQITGQLSGTIGQVGTYTVSIPEQNVGPGSLNISYGQLTVASVVTGSGVVIGDVLSSSGGTALVLGTVVTAFISGSGGTSSVVVVYPPQSGAVGNETISAQLAQETKWYATSVGNVGELVKISSWQTSLG